MKRSRILVLCLAALLILVACDTDATPSTTPNETKTMSTTTRTAFTFTTRSPQEIAEIYAFVTEDRMRMLQATTQIAMQRYGFPDNTSSQLKDWTFASNTLNATNFWITTTQDPFLGRVKTIFVWSGRDADDLELVYLFVGGEDIYDQLQEAKDKAFDG